MLIKTCHLIGDIMVFYQHQTIYDVCRHYAATQIHKVIVRSNSSYWWIPTSESDVHIDSTVVCCMKQTLFPAMRESLKLFQHTKH